MGRHERHTALLKLLVAVAWADGKIQASELNFIKRLVLRFGLDDEIWGELEPYLDEPVDDAERQALAATLRDHLRMPGARSEVLEFLEQMTGADQTVTTEEEEALQQIRTVLQSDESSGLLGGLKRLFGGGAGTRASEHLGRDVDSFLHNKILYRLRRQLKQREAHVAADDRRLSFCALFGGLLGRVMAADGCLHEKEVDAMRRVLAEHSNLHAEHSELVTSVVSEESMKGLDRYHLLQGFLELSTPEERRMLVSCLFDVATADHDLPAKEHEEIRSIAYGLGLSHRQFIEAKLPFTARLKN